MELGVDHVIWTRDGGHDGLLPGRWNAWAEWANTSGYGPTEAAAVDDCKRTMMATGKHVGWLHLVPVRRLPAPPEPRTIRRRSGP